MPRRPKKPWNAGKNLFPELTGGKPIPPPAPMPPPSGPAATLTTGRMVRTEDELTWECLFCEQLAAGVASPLATEHSLRCPKRDPAVKS
jgi:hypothetical protein